MECDVIINLILTFFKLFKFDLISEGSLRHSILFHSI